MSRCYRRPTPRAGRDFIFTTFSNRQGSCIFALAAAQAAQNLTNHNVTLAYMNQGDTGENAKQTAQAQGIELEVVKHNEGKHGFILLPRRWVVERGFGWAGRFRRLVRDYACLTQPIAGCHYRAFAYLMRHRLIVFFSSS